MLLLGRNKSFLQRKPAGGDEQNDPIRLGEGRTTSRRY